MLMELSQHPLLQREQGCQKPSLTRSSMTSNGMELLNQLTLSQDIAMRK